MIRENMINLLVQDEIYWANADAPYLEDVFKLGCRGFKDFTNEELFEEITERFEGYAHMLDVKPYGMYTRADGSQVLFNRSYEPMLQRDADGQNVHEVSGWLHDVKKEQHFYYDGNPPDLSPITRALCDKAMVMFVHGENLDDLLAFAKERIDGRIK